MMIDIVKVIAALGLGYLLGSLNAAVIVGKLYGKDIRDHGSKSAGLTNTLRVLGKPAAGLVLAGDILKGVIACLIGLHLGVYAGPAQVGPAQVGPMPASDCVSLLAAGAGAVIGHNWPLYFGFKGGKGALTAVTVLFMIDWVMALICLGLFVTTVALSRYVSLGTILATALFAALSFIPVFGSAVSFHVFACVMALIVLVKHRTNIQRLLAGSENRLRF